MAEGTPARIDRAALERIIRRAAELQAAEHEIDEHLTPEQLLAVGREVGIPGRYLQQAMLEERTRIAVAAPSGMWNRLVGPAELVAQRVVRGDPEAIERDLLRWMDDHELLCVQRRQPGRISWEPLRGVQAAIRRSAAAFGSGRRPFMLLRAEMVSSIVVGLEPGYSQVTLSARASSARRAYIGSSVAAVAAGVGTAAVLTALHAMLLLALVPIPAALGLGYGVLRQYAPAAARIQLGLERALDSLEQGGATPQRPLPEQMGLLSLLAEEVRKTLRS